MKIFSKEFKETVKVIIRGIVYWSKQLLPLTYRSKYVKDGKKVFCVWRMWFGQCFDIEEYQIVED